MPIAPRSMPRAPCEANGRKAARGSGGNARSARTRFKALPRSGAVSASVPSRSKRTASTGNGAGFIALFMAAEGGDVVHCRVRSEPVDACERVIGHARDRIDLHAGGTRERRDFGGLEEARVFMR